MKPAFSLNSFILLLKFPFFLNLFLLWIYIMGPSHYDDEVSIIAYKEFSSNWKVKSCACAARENEYKSQSFDKKG